MWTRKPIEVAVFALLVLWFIGCPAPTDVDITNDGGDPPSGGGDDVLRVVPTGSASDATGVFTELDGASAVTTVTIGSSVYALVASRHDDGLQIIDVSDPANPALVACVSDEIGGFNELSGARGVTTTVIGSSTYALVAAADDGGVQVVDISDPAAPTVTANVSDTEAGFELLGDADGITTVTIGDSTYALVTSGFYRNILVMDVSEPATPIAVSDIGSPDLSGASGIATVEIDSATYAVVAARLDDCIHIYNISDPTTPLLTASLYDGVDGFDELGGAGAVTIADIGDSTYAFVGSPRDDGVQIIDISNPASPLPTASISDGIAGFDQLAGAAAVTIRTIDTSTYAYVASHSDDGVQVVDVSIPSNPMPIAAVSDGVDGFSELDGAWAITTESIGGQVYAFVASTDDDGVQIVDVTNPSEPSATASLTDDRGVFYLESPSDIATAQIGASTYAVVARYNDGGVQIIDITDPSAPTPTATVSDTTEGFEDLIGANGVGTVGVGSSTYALVAVSLQDSVQIIDITEPSQPAVAAILSDGFAGFDELRGAEGIDVFTIGLSTYALVASRQDDGVQIVDISIPSSPLAVGSITDGINGFDELDGASAVATATIDGSVYAFVASEFDDGVQIVDVTDPSSPSPTAAIRDNVAGFEELDGATGIATATIGTVPYAFVASIEDDGMQIIDVSVPTSPVSVASVSIDASQFDKLDGPSDIAITKIGGSVYAIVTNYVSRGVQVIDVSLPWSPRPVVWLEDDMEGYEELAGAVAITTATIDTSTYAVVAAYLDNGVQIIGFK